MNETFVDMNRREFLKKVGLSSMALAALPTAGHLLATPAQAGGQTNFHFLALSTAGVVDGIYHDIIMGGHGRITPGNVVGNGSFQHQNTDPALPTPKPILGEGTWKAKRLVSWDQLGTYGDVGVAGTLVMEVDLVPVDGPTLSATLEVVCNIPPGGLFTGKPEGYVLDVPGPLTFKPFGPPPLGITWFTSAVEPRGG